VARVAASPTTIAGGRRGPGTCDPVARDVTGAAEGLVQLEVWAFNERALRCYRAAGFTEEGRRRQVTFHDGRWHDEVLMSVLQPEWAAGTLDL